MAGGEGTLRVATWNLWWRFGPWEERQPAIAATLRALDADVVACQEVWGDGATSQAEVLGAELGLHHAYVSLHEAGGLRFGNAVLSRWPLVAAHHRPLPAAEGPSHRSVLHARVAGPRGGLDVFTTHLDYRFDRSAVRQAQVAEVCRFVAEHRHDDALALLAGDLNAEPGSDEVRMLTGRTSVPVPGLVFHDAWEQGGEGDGATWSRANAHLSDPAWPERRLDYVLVGWPRPAGVGRTLGARLGGVDPVEGVQPSDHYAVVADLTY